MEAKQFYSVLTGDIVGSSKLEFAERTVVLTELERFLARIQHDFPGVAFARFSRYRGDSFQIVLSPPKAALRVGIAVRASLRAIPPKQPGRQMNDVRIGIGIGHIDSLPGKSVLEGDGEAFRRSGRTLDEMKDPLRLQVRTPWPELDEEFDIECSLLEVIASRWSMAQAQATIRDIMGFTQEVSAKELGISQPAVVQRLKKAGVWAIHRMCSRYEELLDRVDPRQGA